ncbi:hypothetical protein DL96DRAFT_1621640 [Flagelloscypha sp. PMI_526]|nr:hypothetical protein DL96DRAFT_1621640 [Flagelloscypha sp. PMI_526]
MSYELGLDVLREIVHFVHDVKRSTIFSLNLVNKDFYSIVLPFVYREWSFDVTEGITPEDTECIREWTCEESSFSWIPAVIRQITLRHSSYCSYPINPTTWNPFLSLIPQMTNLARLIFFVPGAQFPTELLRPLEIHTPNVRLTIKYWSSGGGVASLSPDEKLLLQSPLLRELHTINAHHLEDITFVALRRLISLAPKLEKLTVSAHPSGWEMPGWDSSWLHRQGDILQAQQISRGLSDGENQPLCRFRELNLTFAPSSFVGYCMAIGDPGHLERLETRLPILHPGPPSLHPLSFTALRHLALQTYDSNPYSVLHSFFQDRCTTTSLESFTLRTAFPIPEDILPRFLDVHGKTLRTLDLQNDLSNADSYSAGRQSPFSSIKIESISLIGDKCPVLTHLSLCVSRKDDGIFDHFAVFPPSLRHLSLNFGSGFSFIHADMFDFRPELADFSTKSGSEIDEWETTLWLHMPMSISSAEKMFRRIWREGTGLSSLESLIIKTRHPWSLRTRQEFTVRREVSGSGMELATDLQGYTIPHGEDALLIFNDEFPRPKRLEAMWAKVCPDILSTL